MSVPKTASEVRKSFIDFFESKGHQFIRSAPVVPQDDPTLMFINAGMNQFKNIFLGENPKGLTRAANSQKCIRVSGKHNDLDEVGRDTYHHTLFEMLGNWSFGDYYKKEAIEWAWELLTQVWKLPKERLFVTVYKDDDEAAELWKSISGLPEDRIMRFGEKDNFWEMGETGPCGPCSEIHFDKGDLPTQANTFSDPVGGVNGENDRYIEIWNLVFIQYERLANGSLKPLASTHVDTGMGFERICAILQGVRSNYDTDVFTSIIHQIAQLSGVPYAQTEAGMPHRVIADHLRAVSFAVADGAMPSNDGRGYVLRRILRRASRYARMLGQTDAFIYKLVPELVQVMGSAFPELVERSEFVTQVIRAEEERFIKTLGTGLDLFEKIVSELQGRSMIPGEQVFVLYDTYGFPPDLTRILAEEKGLTIDEPGFENYMQEQRERARASQKSVLSSAAGEGWTVLQSTDTTLFTGYESYTESVQIMRYHLQEDVISIVLDKTPFYAESGGQVGEKGTLVTEQLEIAIFDTIKVNDSIIHKGKVQKGQITPQTMQSVFVAAVNQEERLAVRRHHSATHLLQAALQTVLGSHVQQQGSRVSATSLRFDFSHFQGLSAQELNTVEQLVNAQILENHVVSAHLMDLEQAKAGGAMALFGEKYDDTVRVISMSSFSKELCGGLHVNATGQIGSFRILSEAGVAAGVRRIEAVAGVQAMQVGMSERTTLQELRAQLKCKPDTILPRVQTLLEDNKKLEKQLKALEKEVAKSKLQAIFSKKLELSTTPDLSLWVQLVGDTTPAALSGLSEALAESMPQEGVAVLASQDEQSGTVIVVCSPQAVKIGLKAGAIVAKLAELAGGKGGGRPDKAQAGTKEPQKIPSAIAQAKQVIQSFLA
jgi:alanyl-tRNA synthetase